MKKTLLTLAALVLGACAQPQLEQVHETVLTCKGPNYGFTSTTSRELQQVHGYYYDKVQDNYFLVGHEPFAVFELQGHEVLVNAKGLFIDGQLAGEIACN